MSMGEPVRFWDGSYAFAFVVYGPGGVVGSSDSLRACRSHISLARVENDDENCGGDDGPDYRVVANVERCGLVLETHIERYNEMREAVRAVRGKNWLETKKERQRERARIRRMIKAQGDKPTAAYPWRVRPGQTCT
jgi:hypothetical protein